MRRFLLAALVLGLAGAEAEAGCRGGAFARWRQRRADRHQPAAVSSCGSCAAPQAVQHSTVYPQFTAVGYVTIPPRPAAAAPACGPGGCSIPAQSLPVRP